MPTDLRLENKFVSLANKIEINKYLCNTELSADKNK